MVLAVTLQVLKAHSNLLKPEASHTVLALAHDGVGVGDDIGLGAACGAVFA